MNETVMTWEAPLLNMFDPLLVQQLNPTTPTEEKSAMIVIDVSTLYADTGTAKLSSLPEYVQTALTQAGNGQHVVLTGPGPVWLYLYIAHALHGKVLSLSYDSPATGQIMVFNHDPH
jgi:hypothetical protein